MRIIPTNIFRLHSAGILFLLMALTGCKDDLDIPSNECDDPGREVLMPVSINVEEMVSLNSVSRVEAEPGDPTVLEDEKRLHDIWIIQYNSAGYRVGTPNYELVEGQGIKHDIAILVPTQPGKKFTTVVIGNTGDPKLFTDKNSETIRALKDVHKPMKNADDVWNIIDGERHLLMSGRMDVDINTRSLSVHLQPNVAKLHLKFKLVKMSDGEGDAGGGNSWDRKRRTLAVHWGNVPDIPYADVLYESDSYNDEEHRYPSSVNNANLNLFPITTDKAALNTIIGTALDFSDKPSAIDVYLPRNTQGINQNTDPYLKSTYATENALYLEIISRDKEETQQNKFRRIHFLPGGNAVNDYNIIPGKFYELDFTFSNFPTDDGPVKKLYRRYPEANAYIVDPSDINIVNRFPISPANNYATGVYPNGTKKNYWEESYYKIYLQELNEVNNDVTGQLTQDPVTWESRDDYFTKLTDPWHEPVLTFAITPGTQWVAEVIWQDRPQRLINFCDYLGLLTNNGDYYESAGAMWLPVKTADIKNFLTTFLAKGGTTDTLDPAAFKDPYNDRNPTRSEIFFKTTGQKGNVIVGIRKKTQSEKDGGPAPELTEREYLWSWHLWITDYNPAALGQSTMDRNIGAMEPGEVGFYYQFNRKDPFPHWNAKVYDIHGNELTQLTHKVGSGVDETSVSMLCYQYNIEGKNPTTTEKNAAKLKGVNSPFTLIYHTVKGTGTGATLIRSTAGFDYTANNPASWSVTSSTTPWTPEDPSPQGWVLPPDEKQLETPAGSWIITDSWSGLDIPVSGLLSDPYTSTDIDYIFRPSGNFLWVTRFAPTNVNPENTGLLPNTTTVTGPYYPVGFKMKVDALPVRCKKKK